MSEPWSSQASCLFYKIEMKRRWYECLDSLVNLRLDTRQPQYTTQCGAFKTSIQDDLSRLLQIPLLWSYYLKHNQASIRWFGQHPSRSTWPYSSKVRASIKDTRSCSYILVTMCHQWYVPKEPVLLSKATKTNTVKVARVSVARAATNRSLQ